MPESHDNVARILADAAREGVPVTLSGAGTGLTGGRVPDGGSLLSLEKFRALEIGRGVARVGAGVLLMDLQRAALSSGQFYAPDPTERTSALGGNIATNASGSRSFRYGSTRAHVLALLVVTTDGTVRWYRRGDAVDFAVPALPVRAVTKSTAGYPLRPNMDWVDLFIGSEGTLGVVLEAELKLLPAPDELLAGVVFFKSDDDALRAVDDWRADGSLRMLEYLDDRSLAMMRPTFPDIPQHASAALLVEQEGLDTALLERHGADGWFATDDRGREQFRRFRHALPEIVNGTVRSRGFMKLGSDYAVPVARNREMLARYRERLAGFDYVVFGHIGDAHVHANVLPRSSTEFDAATAAMLTLARDAVALGGTVSAEHGLGKRKRHLLALQYTPAQIESMKGVKRRLDPNWILGRGNLFDAPVLRYPEI